MRVEVSTWIKVCCFVDFLGVALVIPQMSAYFTNAGVSNDYYGFIMSVYYFSQIIGGVVMGSLTDLISRRDILIISFLGSSVSYTVVGLSSDLYVLFGSRIIVGLVKQTLSISTAILASVCENPLDRAEQLGHINATVTLAFIVGPSIGSLLYGIDPSYPALAASALFLVNIAICLATIPKNLDSTMPSKGKASLMSKNDKSEGASSFSKDVASLMEHSSVLVGPLLSLVLITFVERSMKETNILSYFEIRYNLDTKNIGFVSSISALFAFLANTLFVTRFISFCGNSKERSMVLALILCAVASFLELICQDIYHYVVLVVPLFMISSSVVMTLSKSVLSCSIPHEHVGKTLAVFGVLESIVGVIAPLYGTHFFTKLGYCSRGWVGGAHYVVAAVVLWAALVHGKNTVHHSPDESTSVKVEDKKQK